MSTPIPSTTNSSNFFGVDNPVFFMGQVENVNDPFLSNRVQVRCIGVHPLNETGKGGLKTDDLPWAHCGMPVTHGQLDRIGGKHYLQVGSWVMGLFLDGDDKQDPFVLCSTNLTNNSLSEYITKTILRIYTLEML